MSILGFELEQRQVRQTLEIDCSSDVLLYVLLSLFSGDPELPGNYGMWDQLLAMKWVRNHIAGKINAWVLGITIVYNT